MAKFSKENSKGNSTKGNGSERGRSGSRCGDLFGIGAGFGGAAAADRSKKQGGRKK